MALDDEVVGSASVGGRLVRVALTASPGTLLHSATPTANRWDVITILAVNNDTVTRTLTIEWGEAAATTHTVKQMRPQQGMELIVDRFRLKRGLPFLVSAFADAANVIHCYVQVEQLI